MQQLILKFICLLKKTVPIFCYKKKPIMFEHTLYKLYNYSTQCIHTTAYSTLAADTIQCLMKFSDEQDKIH